MRHALERSGISLKGKDLKSCSDYSSQFDDHQPGHVRSAQQLANVFYREPRLLRRNVKREICEGFIDAKTGKSIGEFTAYARPAKVDMKASYPLHF